MSISEEEFHALVTKALTLVSVRGMAERFDMSLPSVRLWKAGKNSPAPPMREVMTIKLQNIINTIDADMQNTINNITCITDEMLNDDKVFASLVGMAAAYLETPVIAERFNTSHSTIDRWVCGVTAPHPVMRPTVRKVAIQFLTDKMNQDKS